MAGMLTTAIAATQMSSPTFFMDTDIDCVYFSTARLLKVAENAKEPLDAEVEYVRLSAPVPPR